MTIDDTHPIKRRRPTLDFEALNNKTLRALFRSAQDHQHKEMRLLQCLPSNLSAHCRFVSLNGGKLTLSTDTSVRASQLRFYQQLILERVKNIPEFAQVATLKVVITPQKAKPVMTRPGMHISQETAQLLKEEALHTQDPDLRKILEKLAKKAQG